MMIAYNKLRLHNRLAIKDLDKAVAANLISAAEGAAAFSMYKQQFYSPNIFVRIGLFLLTNVVVTFSLGLFSMLFFAITNQQGAGTLSIVSGLVCYAFLEWIVANRHHYQSGVDDALVWISAAFIITGINVSGDIGAINNSILILVLSLYFTVRFADRMMLFVAIIAVLVLVFFLLNKAGIYAKAFTPFALMFTSAALYFICKKINNLWRCRFHQHCFTMGTITSLLCFYIAGNYLVVREVSNSLFNLQLLPGQGIPFGWLFWILTLVVPFVYITWGIIKKDIILLRSGLVLIAVIVFTLRFYYSAWPIEMLMITGGVFLIVAAYMLLRWLKVPVAGFSSEADNRLNKGGIENIESIIIAESIPSFAGAEAGNFGGGSLGGGGASGDY